MKFRLISLFGEIGICGFVGLKEFVICTILDRDALNIIRIINIKIITYFMPRFDVLGNLPV